MGGGVEKIAIVGVAGELTDINLMGCQDAINLILGGMMTKKNIIICRRGRVKI